MAGLEDQTRPLNISDLKGLQKHSIVGRCVHWEDVGLQIGLDKSDIDAIKINEHHQVEGCRREMLSKFLRNNYNELTLNDLCITVNRVNNYHETKNEEKNAEFAVNQLVMLLKEWERRNVTIEADLKRSVAYLKQEKSRIYDKTDKWNHNNNEWQLGELENKKIKIQRALSDGNFKWSPIVKELFRSKDIKLSQLSDQVVECILRQDLTEIGLVQVSKMEPDLYKQMKKHHRRIEGLNVEIMAQKKLLDERVQSYHRIEHGLETIGINKDKIEKFNTQLKELKALVEECDELQTHCDEVYQECKSNLDKWTKEIIVIINSFDDNVKKMRKSEPEFVKAIYAIYGLAGGAAVGAVGGGALGTVLLPGIGTAIGAALGTAIGTVVGSASGFLIGTFKGEVERMKMESKVQETISKAQTMHSGLQDLLRD